MQGTISVAGPLPFSTATGVWEGFSDDGEQGASHKLLKLLQEKSESNVMVIVTWVYGNKHLGPKRFDFIKDNANEALTLLNDSIWTALHW